MIQEFLKKNCKHAYYNHCKNDDDYKFFSKYPEKLVGKEGNYIKRWKLIAGARFNCFHLLSYNSFFDD